MLRELLGRLEGDASARLEVARELLRTKEDGRVKMFVTALALRCRRDNRGLFSTGDYLPLEATGLHHEHVFAFARHHASRTAIVAVPRLVARLAAAPDGLPLGPRVWGETRLTLPESCSGPHRNLFTGELLTPTVQGGSPGLPLGEVFGGFPVALLLGQ
jgi:(1->4)-alpha-D-glucan 1-alpha-D-glucosylmutase